jgi:arylsulfatase A-like enzyme
VASHAGVACSLVSDATDLPGAESFADATVVATDVEQPAADVSQTGCASVLAVAAEHLEAWSQAAQADDKLLWVHLHGYMGPWDAPQELRAALLEEDDPVPPTFVEPPQFEATADQDAVLGYRAAYAAQTIVLDECVGGLLAALSAFGLDDSTLVVVIGCRGYALGEHGAVGGEVMSLYGETLHVPCLLRAPGLSPAPPRMTSLAQSADLMATLAAWFGLERVGNGGVDLLAIANSGPTPRQFVAAHGADGEQTLRTPAWLLRVPPEGVGHAAIDRPRRPELYVKPDDRWDRRSLRQRRRATAGGAPAASTARGKPA